ncbi:MAG: RagB/SusD family nutrient uptake outer membrane protein [Bacteroidetes bacterium]|nr:RagB/SusD family nutrient uptake outer membrane protein [Bacteroidota bacterium]
MKIRYIGSSIIVVLLLGMMTSCTKGYLDKNPTDVISSATFWKTETDIQMALTGVYGKLQNGFFGHSKSWLDTYSDNAYDRFGYFGFDQLTMGVVNSSNVTTAFYNVPYAGIASCNYFLDNVDQVPIDDQKKAEYKAEAQFLRALFYFDLVQAYGGVIVYKTAPKTVDESKIKQSTKEEVLAFIHEDLDKAIANLPDETYSGHAVKASAQALKAKVFLFQQKWAEAASLANEIINGGKFSIYQGGYANLFVNAAIQQNNPEIIFSTKYLSPNNPQEGEGVLVEFGWYGAINPYQNLVDEYEMTNGKMINEAGSGYDPADMYANRDPRLKMTIKVPNDPYINPDGTEFQFSDPLLTGYSQKKYLDFKLLPFDRSKIPLTDANIIHIRYADVLLMYAEAKNEESGPDATIYSALNQIRSRAGVNMPPVDEATYNTMDKLRDFIRHERRVELALEGHRYFDLKRWGLMSDKLSALKNPAGTPLVFGEKNNVLPFNQNELDKNPQLVQNTGY